MKSLATSDRRICPRAYLLGAFQFEYSAAYAPLSSWTSTVAKKDPPVSLHLKRSVLVRGNSVLYPEAVEA